MTGLCSRCASPSEPRFYERRGASTRDTSKKRKMDELLRGWTEGGGASLWEGQLPRGRTRRMNDINGLPNLLSCSHNRTQDWTTTFTEGTIKPFCCRITHLGHKERTHYRQLSCSRRLNSKLETPLSLSTCLLQPFIGGSKHCSILVSRPKKHSIENLRTKPPLQPPHFTQLKFSHLCLVPQCAILWYPKAPVTIQL